MAGQERGLIVGARTAPVLIRQERLLMRHTRVLLLLFLTVVGFYGGLGFRGGTMQPLRIVHGSQAGTTLRAGDLVMLASPEKTTVMPGDVVLIKQSASPGPVLQRVVETRTADAGLGLLTRDHTSQLVPVAGSAVQAKVVGRLPVAGYALEWLALMGMSISVAALVGYSMVRLRRRGLPSRSLVYER